MNLHFYIELDKECQLARLETNCGHQISTFNNEIEQLTDTPLINNKGAITKITRHEN